MYAAATCSTSIIRSTATDEYGDPTDNPAADPIYTGVPASILVSSSFITPQGASTPRQVLRYSGQIGSDTDIQKNDLLRDDTHGITYTVAGVVQGNGIGHTPDLELELDRLA